MSALRGRALRVCPILALALVSLAAPAASAPARPLAPPPNDDLTNATPIVQLPYTDAQDLDEATDEPDEVPSSCAISDEEMGVWYRLAGLGPETVTVVLDTAGSVNEVGGDVDTVLSVWTGQGHPLEEVLCNDDRDIVDFTSRVVLRLEPEATYYVKVGTNDAGGRARLAVRRADAVPPNDDLADATAVEEVPFTDSQSLEYATWERGEEISACQMAWPEEHGIWYALTADEATTVVVDTEGSVAPDGGGLDTVLSAWTGASHPLAERLCNDDTGAGVTWSRIVLDLEPDETVYVKVAGIVGERGVAVLNVWPLPTAPGNDDLAAAAPISALPHSDRVDTSAATTEPLEALASCGLAVAQERSVWYRYEPSESARVVFAATDFAFSPVVSVWTGTGHPLTEVACSAERVGSEPVGLVVALEAGQPVFVRLSGLEGQGGPVTLMAVEAPPGPENDDLADAIQVPALPFEDRRSTIAATDEPDEARASCARIPGAERAVWYAYQAADAVRLRVEGDARGGLLDVPATVSAWAAGSGHPLGEIGCATSPRGLDLEVAAGDTVLFKIGPALDQQGTVVLRLEASPPVPPNDDVADAIDVDALPFAHEADTRSATDEAAETRSRCNFDPTAAEAGVWYRYERPVASRIALDTSGSELAAEVLSVWRGGPGHPLVEVACASRILAGDAPRLLLDAEAGTAYFIKTAGDAGLRGRITLNAAVAAARPPNDDLADAAAIGRLPYEDIVDTRTATDEPDEARASCGLGVGAEHGVWYRLAAGVAEPASSVHLSTEGSGFDTVLSVWTGGGGHPLQELACNDDAPGGAWSELRLALQPGVEYFVKAGGGGGAAGRLALSARVPVEWVFLPYLER